MSNPKEQYSVQLVQSPWEMYENLNETILKVSTENKQFYDYNRVWLPRLLQTCSFRFEFYKCELEALYDSLLAKGITPELLITTEDNSKWTNYTQSYDIKMITSSQHQVINFRPKTQVSAHDGLVVRVRIIVKHLSMKRDKALQQYSVLSEKVFLLHVDTHASDFSVRLVDNVDNKMGFRVVLNYNSNPFEQSIHECITIEFMSKAYLRYQQISHTNVGKALSKLILGHIISEVVYSVISIVNEQFDDFIIDTEVIEKPMVNQLYSLLKYSSFKEFQRDCKDNPERIIQRARTVVDIEGSFLTI